MVRDGGRIASNYLRGSFTIDVLGSFPISIILEILDSDGESKATARLNKQLRLLRIVKLNRLLRLSRLAKNLKYLELAIKFNPSVMRLVKLVALMMIMCHCSHGRATHTLEQLAPILQMLFGYRHAPRAAPCAAAAAACMH